MSNITDLEKRINSAESTLEMLRGELEELKQQEQQEPEKGDLFGRWATHKEYGRGIIVSIKPDGEGEVRFAYRSGSYMGYVDERFVRPESLDLDPATLTTAEDFQDAPDGTVVETGDMRICHKIEKNAWLHSGLETVYTHLGMASLAECTPCRVIRWGPANDHL